MQQLSAQDASFIYLESAAAPMHLGSLCIYDGKDAAADQLSEESITRAIDERLHLNPTMRRRLARVPFEADYPYWIEDASFDLEYHVRRIALPRPGDRATLMKTVARIFSRPLDISKYGLIYAGAQKNLGPSGVTLDHPGRSGSSWKQ